MPADMCERCDDNFFGDQCDSCPGAMGQDTLNIANTCTKRGLCKWGRDAGAGLMRFDNPQLNSLKRGECKCNEPFTGADCGKGKCPPGKEPTMNITSGLIECTPCPPGFSKEHTAVASPGGMCIKCPDGSFFDRSQPKCNATSTINNCCTRCPVGASPSESGDGCDCPKDTVAYGSGAGMECIDCAKYLKGMECTKAGQWRRCLTRVACPTCHEGIHQCVVFAWLLVPMHTFVR